MGLEEKTFTMLGSFFMELGSLARHAVPSIVATFISYADKTHLMAHLPLRVDVPPSSLAGMAMIGFHVGLSL